MYCGRRGFPSCAAYIDARRRISSLLRMKKGLLLGNRSPKECTPFPGLFWAGAWGHPTKPPVLEPRKFSHLAWVEQPNSVSVGLSWEGFGHPIGHPPPAKAGASEYY